MKHSKIGASSCERFWNCPGSINACEQLPPEETSPYADLPPAERSALNDISAFLQNDDKKSARQKLTELGGMIQARYDDILKLQRINKYSVPLAGAGMVMTILFGLLAIFR